MNKGKHLFWIVLLVSFLIRFATIKTGLPSETMRLATYHPDESITFYSLERMNPSKFDFYPGDSLYWGTFLVYLEGFTAKAMEFLGMIDLTGREGLKNNLREADKLYISGRLIAVLFGIGCVYGMFLIAGLFFDRGWALASAFLAGINYAFIYTSIFVKPDSIMLFWGLFSVYCSLLLVRTERKKYYILSGIFAGLSAVSKYNGAIFCLFLFFAHLCLVYRHKKGTYNLKYLLLAALCSFGVFIIVNPYFIIRNSDAMRYMLGMAQKSNWPSNLIKGYANYFLYTLNIVMGLPLLILSIGGFIKFLEKFSLERMIIFAFSLAYILWLGPAEGQAINYCLLLIPFFILFAVDYAARLWKKKIGRGIVTFVFLYTFCYSAYLVNFYAHSSTLKEASLWMSENIPAKSKIAISKNDTWTPPIIRSYNSPYRITEGGSSKAPLREAFFSFLQIYGKGDYVLLSDTECYLLAKKSCFNATNEFPINEIFKNTKKVKVFRKEFNPFFVPFDNPHLFELMWSSPAIYILKPKATCAQVAKGII